MSRHPGRCTQTTGRRRRACEVFWKLHVDVLAAAQKASVASSAQSENGEHLCARTAPALRRIRPSKCLLVPSIFGLIFQAVVPAGNPRERKKERERDRGRDRGSGARLLRFCVNSCKRRSCPRTNQKRLRAAPLPLHILRSATFFTCVSSWRSMGESLPHRSAWRFDVSLSQALRTLGPFGPLGACASKQRPPSSAVLPATKTQQEIPERLSGARCRSASGSSSQRCWRARCDTRPAFCRCSPHSAAALTALPALCWPRGGPARSSPGNLRQSLAAPR